MLKISKFGRLFKIIKVTKLVRLIKIVKMNNSFFKIVALYLQVGVGFDRVFFLMFVLIILCHLIACLWLYIPNLLSEDKNY